MKKVKNIWKAYWKLVKYLYIFVGIGTVMKAIAKHPEWDGIKVWRKVITKSFKAIEHWYNKLMEMIGSLIALSMMQ